MDYLIKSDNHIKGYLLRGDVIKLCFVSERFVGEDESVRIALIPKVGSPTFIDTALPDIISEQRINIYPI